MPHSHHSHSGQFCRHAKDQLEDIVTEAIRQGFEVLGLTEHAPRYRVEDLFPEEADLNPIDLEHAYSSFLDEAKRLRSIYSDRISLLIGLETDFITTLDLTRTTSLLQQRTDIDYVVGSVHHVNGISIDFDTPTWLRCVHTTAAGDIGATVTIDPSSNRLILPPLSPSKDTPPTNTQLTAFLLSYFDAQYEMIKSHQPEVIGHFDLCLLWTPDLSLRSSELSCVWAKVERNVGYAIDYGALFEANAAALRKGWKTSYPSGDVLQLILTLGGRICLSDDSHGISYVGLNYPRMRDSLVVSGVKEIWYLVPTKRRIEGDVEIGYRGRVVARRVKNWQTHSFWSRLEAAQSVDV